MAVQIAVVGAGVVGCSVALRLQEVLASSAVVTVVSEAFSPHTTSDAAGAIMIPFDVTTGGGGGTQDEDLKKWTRATFQYLKELTNSDEAGLMDLQLVNGYYSDEGYADESKPWWSDLTSGFRHVGTEEAKQMNIPAKFKVVYAFNTYILNGRKYLPWMMDKIRNKGGTFMQKKITDLSELSGYDVVINCTGLGSYELVGDRTMYPVHGDAVLVDAPWLKQFFILMGKQDLTYMFPRSHDLLLGGTKRIDDWSVTPDESSLQALKGRCTDIVPSLAHAREIMTWAGLRPTRDSVRLEKDLGQTACPLLIHCYGHGGQGVLLSWGCALDVAAMVVKHLEEKRYVKHKL